jgi:hypothetical protein
VTFFAWLCGLDKIELGRVIANRRETTVVAGPLRDRAQLASVLQNETLVGVQYLLANRPVHDVAEMVAAMGGQSTMEALAKAFDLAADDPDLAEAVDWLTSRALAWPDAQGLHLVPALMNRIPYPHRLGTEARQILGAQTVAVLSAISSRWGLRPAKNKPSLVAAMTDWLADPDNVRQLLRKAPADVRNGIEHLAWEAPVTAEPTPAVLWALEHGLVYRRLWSDVEMPGEVGRAVRGPDWRPTFTARPPDPITASVAPGMVTRESAAAAMMVLDQVGALTAECARKPVPSLKTGGIGVRELRRLGKIAGCDERSVRLWLDVAFEASLLEFEGDEDSQRLLATVGYDAWLAEEPAVRLTRLLTAWHRLASEPYAEAEAEPRVPALTEPDDPSRFPTIARRELLTAAGRLPQDRGLVADDGLAPVIAWQMPGLHFDSAGLAFLWQEARAMGIAAHGALTPLGRALAAGADGEQLTAVARDLVGAPTTSAIFQADLTAIVPGIPGHALAHLLDSAADRESRGGALIWRFSSASVRRALDAGLTPDELTAQLVAASGGGVIPQPLAYLITDIGRQHGRIRVRETGCVIHGVEEALLTEILTAKSLRGLGLTRIVPTVLAAASPQAETLSALRAAGYFPGAELPDGNPQIPVAAQPRAVALPPQQPYGHGLLPFVEAPSGTSTDQMDPYELAEQLCGRPPGKEALYPTRLSGLPFSMAEPDEVLFGLSGLDDDDDEYDGGDFEMTSEQHVLLHQAIEEYADTLDPQSICMLASAIEVSESVRIIYKPIGSRTKQRVNLKPEMVQGEWLRGRDLLSGNQIRLQLGDLERVVPL